jgi:hypothetical protein
MEKVFSVCSNFSSIQSINLDTKKSNKKVKKNIIFLRYTIIIYAPF